MTQMADPLTALIHAVQVMNFLKMLIMKTMRQRAEVAIGVVMLSSSSCSRSLSDQDGVNMSKENVKFCEGSQEKPVDVCIFDKGTLGKFILNDECGLESDDVESFWSFEKESITAEPELIHEESLPMRSNECTAEEYKSEYGKEDVRAKDRLNFRNGVKKLCRHPVFLLSRSVKRSRGQGIVNS
uniref:Glucose-1-phosphate adenylyltransferase n=1 Tax=Anthurium amnicola TaxID=1678845 RepID=A0A1D1Z244_9ARAE